MTSLLAQRGAGLALRGARPLTLEALPPILLTIHITNTQLNYSTTFLTNTSCFQLKSVLEILRTIKFRYFCVKSR